MCTASFDVADLIPKLTARVYEWGDLWGFEYNLIIPGVDTTNLLGNPRYTPICTYDDPVYGAGSLYSSAEELCNFLIMIKDDGIYKGKQILSKNSVDMIFSGQVGREYLPPWLVDLKMGGYAMQLDNDEAVWGHTGADPGMSSILFFNRDIDLGVVVLANRFFDIRDLISWTFATGFKAFSNHNIVQKNSNWSLYCGKTKDGYLNERTVAIRVHVKNVQDNDLIYINGNHHKIGGWISKGIPLFMSGENYWSREFAFYDSTKLMF